MTIYCWPTGAAVAANAKAVKIAIVQLRISARVNPIIKVIGIIKIRRLHSSCQIHIASLGLSPTASGKRRANVDGRRSGRWFGPSFGKLQKHSQHSCTEGDSQNITDCFYFVFHFFENWIKIKVISSLTFLIAFLLRGSFNKFVDPQWATWALDGFGGGRTRNAVGTAFCNWATAISQASAIIGGSASKVSNGGGGFKPTIGGDSAKGVDSCV